MILSFMIGCEKPSELTAAPEDKTARTSERRDAVTLAVPDMARDLAKEAHQHERRAARLARATEEVVSAASAAETEARRRLARGDYSGVRTSTEFCGDQARVCRAFAGEASRCAAAAKRAAIEAEFLTGSVTEQLGGNASQSKACLAAVQEAKEASRGAAESARRASRCAESASSLAGSCRRLAETATLAAGLHQATGAAREASDAALFQERRARAELGNAQAGHARALEAAAQHRPGAMKATAGVTAASATRAAQAASEAKVKADQASRQFESALAKAKQMPSSLGPGLAKIRDRSVAGARNAARTAESAHAGAARYAADAKRLADEVANIESIPAAREKVIAAKQKPKGSEEPDGKRPIRGAPEAASKPAPSTRPAHTAGRTRVRVDMRKIPDLPHLPKIRTRPKGIVIATTRPSRRVSTNDGRWVQVAGGTAADFLPGGYESNMLVFRHDGSMEVTRTFIGKGRISQKWRIGFRLDEKKGMLVLGADRENQPSASLMRGEHLLKLVPSIKPGIRSLPVELRMERVSNEVIRVDGKTYKRVGNSQ